jgi:hypothetical protein
VRRLQFLKQIRVTRVETRPKDSWYDLSLRQLRSGEVSFYRVRDFLTGDWLFKTCRDNELGKFLVKAVKCPAGARFAQLEGNTMVFQRSQSEGMLYDVVSLTQADDSDKISRKIVSNIDDVPDIIRENYQVTPYEEATGKTAPGKNLVTLSKDEDERAMITLFLLERAWTLSDTTPEEKVIALQEREMAKPQEMRKEIDTGQILKCSICGDEFRMKHIETERVTKHSLKNSQ